MKLIIPTQWLAPVEGPLELRRVMRLDLSVRPPTPPPRPSFVTKFGTQ